MTRNLTLLIFVILNTFYLNAKNDFKIEEIQASDVEVATSRMNTDNYRFEQKDYLVIQPKINSYSYLQENGFNIQSYLGDGYYLVTTKSNNTNSCLQKSLYHKVGYILPENKVDKNLSTENIAKLITVLYAPSTELNTIKLICEQSGVALNSIDEKNHHFTTIASTTQIFQLAKYPFIYYLTTYYPNKNPLIYEGGIMIGVNQIQEQQPYGYNLKGENVNVGIWDEGAVGNHIDLPTNRNFVVDKELNQIANMNHPTEVGGCIAAGGNIFFSFKGIAPSTNLYYWDVLNDIVKEIESGKTNYNIDISNHSYNFSATTCAESGTYIPEAADLDKLVYNNKSLLPIVAVGNTASTNCAVATDTFSSVDIGFQGCKNVITVGWLFSNGKIVENSGRGPTTDGRLKPELVAKGFAVSTILPNNGFGQVYGSSYAAPQVAGLATQLYQKYKQQFGAFPNGALIKSILCNTAEDLGKPGPDYIYGFGIPNARKAVYTIENNLFQENSISQNEIKSFQVNIPTNISKVNVTLCWTDKEGNPVANKSLVNNLDLKIVTPNGDTVLPWILNPNQPKFTALRGIDNLNNIEQVTINAVSAGSYTIIVKGTDVPFANQAYAVSYFLQERKLELSYPNGGEILDAGNQVTIRWFNNTIDTLARIEFSNNNGTTWQTLVNNINLSQQNYNWSLIGSSAVISNQCLIRITAGNSVVTSAAPFSIGAQINYPQINYTTCDRTIKINWPLVTDATGYSIYLFIDTAWIKVGQTSQNTYTINNLTNGKNYVYAISTIKNGFECNRSFFTQFTTKVTPCTTLNDVGVYAINNPAIGRKFTSSALTTTEKLSFIIKNFGTATQNSVVVNYKINGGATRTTTLSDIITSNDTSIVKFNINENLSNVGNYNIIAWTSLSGDNNSDNDTLKYTIKHLANAPIALPFSESFEQTNEVLTNTAFGISGLEYADYNCEQGARLRSNESNLYALNGKRAITLDNYLNLAPAKQNELIFTYNLSNYKDSLIYLDFSYMNRAESDSNDILYARGSDTKPWVRVYDLYTERGLIGKYKNVHEINLYQKLKVENNQDFSSSTQLKIVQSGTKAANSAVGDGGYTFDDFKLYVANHDVAILKSDVTKVHCSKSVSPKPISILVKNNTSQAITNLSVSYQINNELPVIELLPFINAYDTITYNFSTLFNKPVAGLYTIKTWVSNVGDNYKTNDSFNTSTVIVMQTIDSFPYYNDLESNNGNLFSEGMNNSWFWGSPVKYDINNAAQDNKAWTTGSNRGYNFNEDSYLYMGCLDVSTFSNDPLIAFNFISIMQTQSDSAFAEYSTDGVSWKRLGCYNCGLNWYNGYLNKPYWDNTIYPWQTAHINVPLSNLVDKSNFMFRIHLISDEFAVSEGLGIDDIHILKDYTDIATSDSTYVSQTSNGNGWISFYRNGKLVAELFDDNKNLGNISLGYEANISKQKQFNNANIVPRNWVFKAQNSVTGNFKLKLYLLNSEYTTFTINEDSINRIGDIGLLRYIGLNTNLDVSDNHVKAYYKYYTPQDIQFYPYKDGYYVEFNTDTLGEFYLISTKQDKDAIQNVNIIDFFAQKIDNDVYLDWKTTREVNSKDFVIQYSFDATTFIDIDTIPAGGFSSRIIPYNYLHQLNATTGIYYYRIKIIDNSNKISYSLIDSVNFAPNVGVKQNIIYAKAYIATNDIVIDFKNKIQTPATINVFNTNGQLQFTKKMQLINGVNPLGIPNFLNWSNSTYFLQIQTQEQSYYSKLMKL